MVTEFTHALPSAQATDSLGFTLGQALTAPMVIGVVGEMGSGKTTFVRGLARGLGVTGPVNSPTYTLMQRYEGRLRLDHFDAWMESREREVLADGAHELFGHGGVCVVEWADRIEDVLPEERLEVRLEVTGACERIASLRWMGNEPSSEPVDALAAIENWAVPEHGLEG